MKKIHRLFHNKLLKKPTIANSFEKANQISKHRVLQNYKNAWNAELTNIYDSSDSSGSELDEYYEFNPFKTKRKQYFDPGKLESRKSSFEPINEHPEDTKDRIKILKNSERKAEHIKKLREFLKDNGLELMTVTFDYVVPKLNNFTLYVGDIVNIVEKTGEKHWLVETNEGNRVSVPRFYLNLLSDDQIISIIKNLNFTEPSKKIEKTDKEENTDTSSDIGKLEKFEDNTTVTQCEPSSSLKSRLEIQNEQVQKDTEKETVDFSSIDDCLQMINDLLHSDIFDIDTLTQSLEESFESGFYIQSLFTINSSENLTNKHSNSVDSVFGSNYHINLLFSEHTIEESITERPLQQIQNYLDINTNENNHCNNLENENKENVDLRVIQAAPNRYEYFSKYLSDSDFNILHGDVGDSAIENDNIYGPRTSTPRSKAIETSHRVDTKRRTDHTRSVNTNTKNLHGYANKADHSLKGAIENHEEFDLLHGDVSDGTIENENMHGPRTSTPRSKTTEAPCRVDTKKRTDYAHSVNANIKHPHGYTNNVDQLKGPIEKHKEHVSSVNKKSPDIVKSSNKEKKRNEENSNNKNDRDRSDSNTSPELDRNEKTGSVLRLSFRNSIEQHNLLHDSKTDLNVDEKHTATNEKKTEMKQDEIYSSLRRNRTRASTKNKKSHLHDFVRKRFSKQKPNSQFQYMGEL